MDIHDNSLDLEANENDPEIKELLKNLAETLLDKNGKNNLVMLTLKNIQIFF